MTKRADKPNTSRRSFLRKAVAGAGGWMMGVAGWNVPLFPLARENSKDTSSPALGLPPSMSANGTMTLSVICELEGVEGVAVNGELSIANACVARGTPSFESRTEKRSTTD